MKSGTSFFNGAIFRKDMSRFAPVRMLYTLCLLLGMFLMLEGNEEYWFPAHMGSMCSAMAAVNCGYALLVAQVLFGDLWNTRMCNALHALPLRRECWFHTHVISGLFFSILPTSIMVALAETFIIFMSVMEQGWQIPLYFLLATNLQFLFFFSLAVFCALCAGNRVGMAVTYGIANFFAYLIYFLVDTLVTPMYYGVVTQDRLFKLLCPVAWLCSANLVESQMHRLYDNVPAGADYRIHGTFTLGDGWLYLFLLAGIALVLLMVARGMYRRRKLEFAGDFLAAKKLEPLFMVVFPVTVGTIFQWFEVAVLGMTNRLPVMLFAGLAVGWFVGRMLLERQTRVLLRLKNWLGFLLLALALGGCLYGLSLDPLGVEDWVPRAEDVRSVTIGGGRGEVVLKEPAEIEDILSIHRGILTEKLRAGEADAAYQQVLEKVQQTEVLPEHSSWWDMVQKQGYRKCSNIYIRYELENGWTLARDYLMWVDTDHGQLAKTYFSRLEALFYDYQEIHSEADLMAWAKPPQSVIVGDVQLPGDLVTAAAVEDLLRAVLADSQAGTMAQSMSFHDGLVLDTGDCLKAYYSVDLLFPEKSLYFTIFSDSTACLEWMDQYGITDYVLSRIRTSSG